MNSRFIYFFQKYAFFRFLVLSVFFLFLGTCFSYLRVLKAVVPMIDYVEPSPFQKIGMITIYGRNFGQEAEDSFLKIDNIVVPSSLCKIWNDKQIIVPAGMIGEGGLLFVISKNSYSIPIFLPLRNEIPIVKKKEKIQKLPTIEALSKDHGEIGQIIKIYGSNFGNLKENSSVFFLNNKEIRNSFFFDDYDMKNIVSCLTSDFEFWNEEEIHVRIPDGAESGFLVVKTQYGISNTIPFNVHNNVGKKLLVNKKEFTFILETEVSNFKTTSKNILILRTPLPYESISQNQFSTTSIHPDPLIREYIGDIVYKVENIKETDIVNTKSQHKITTYEINTKINSQNIARVRNNQTIYDDYIKETPLLHINNLKVKKISKSIVKDEKNPYLKAKIIYDYILKNFVISKDIFSNLDYSLESTLENQRGSPYDVALLFSTICRIESIPCRTISGIVIDKNKETYVHWWNEFYVDSFGWVPVDIGMALSIPFDNEIKNKEIYYFGNLDPFRIGFSYMEKTTLPLLANSKTYGHQRTFAFASCWEETLGIEGYTCFWHIPHVLTAN